MQRVFSLIFMGLEPKETSYKQPKAMDSIHWGRFENPQEKKKHHIWEQKAPKKMEKQKAHLNKTTSQKQRKIIRNVSEMLFLACFLPAVLVFLV